MAWSQDKARQGCLPRASYRASGKGRTRSAANLHHTVQSGTQCVVNCARDDSTDGRFAHGRLPRPPRPPTASHGLAQRAPRRGSPCASRPRTGEKMLLSPARHNPQQGGPFSGGLLLGFGAIRGPPYWATRAYASDQSRISGPALPCGFLPQARTIQSRRSTTTMYRTTRAQMPLR